MPACSFLRGGVLDGPTLAKDRYRIQSEIQQPTSHTDHEDDAPGRRAEGVVSRRPIGVSGAAAPGGEDEPEIAAADGAVSVEVGIGIVGSPDSQQ